MRLIRRHLSTATHHKKSRRLIVDPAGSAVPIKTVRSCSFYSRPAAKPLRSRPPILRRKVARGKNRGNSSLLRSCSDYQNDSPIKVDLVAQLPLQANAEAVADDQHAD